MLAPVARAAAAAPLRDRCDIAAVGCKALALRSSHRADRRRRAIADAASRAIRRDRAAVRRHQIGFALRVALGFLIVYPSDHAVLAGSQGAHQVDRQFRHPDPDLRDARLGPEHRGRPRRPARSRLRRVLRGRRLFLRAAGQELRPVVLDLLPLAGILAAFWGILLGFPVLRLRGDYLAIVTLAFGEIIRLVLINWVPVTNGYAGISGIPRPTFFGIPFNASDDGFAAVFGLEFTPDLPHDLPLLRDPRARAAHRLRDHAAAPAAGRPRLGSAARGRDRLPLARHQHHQHQAHRLRHGRDVRAALPARSSPRGRASSRRNPSPSWNRR